MNQIKSPLEIKLAIIMTVAFLGLVFFMPEIEPKPTGLNSYESFAYDFNSQITLPLFLAIPSLAIMWFLIKLSDYIWRWKTSLKTS